ncbi:hypothetical protein K503DRAFT_779846 [Rhizopogon vinicolor AM-OR11-026]|uniref:Uncharacterized protein n=1 Tax=Rhizopogon vinicolor AM-OR11-026 TaxID=1314800 RepID=A0A1B7NCD7_9AGAM|nr:hypothetical protein K503DRAFT_779846 [Rhizopogon vinicolor AM-OR11-026]
MPEQALTDAAAVKVTTVARKEKRIIWRVWNSDKPGGTGIYEDITLPRAIDSLIHMPAAQNACRVTTGDDCADTDEFYKQDRIHLFSIGLKSSKFSVVAGGNSKKPGVIKVDLKKLRAEPRVHNRYHIDYLSGVTVLLSANHAPGDMSIWTMVSAAFSIMSSFATACRRTGTGI